MVSGVAKAWLAGPLRNRRARKVRDWREPLP